MRTLLASHDILNGAERGRAVKQYNKLIRDTVPAIMPAGGRRMVTRAVVGEELRAALRAKLEQEVAEYDAAANDDLATIELADLLEVVMALAARRGAARRGIDEATIQRIRATKAEQRGSFDGGHFLLKAE